MKIDPELNQLLDLLITMNIKIRKVMVGKTSPDLEEALKEVLGFSEETVEKLSRAQDKLEAKAEAKAARKTTNQEGFSQGYWEASGRRPIGRSFDE